MVEEELREKKQDFEKLRKVTQVPDVQKLPEHKDFLENCHQNMTFINEILSMEVALMKNDISDLDLELKKMKFDAKAGADQREMKLDDLEKVNIENVNSLEDMSNSVYIYI